MFANRVVAAFVLTAAISGGLAGPAPAQGADAPSAAAEAAADLERLFARLQEPVLPEWQTVEDDIWRIWSRSGSPAMDLLLERGREALEAGDAARAIGHLTALTDHAPDFAEGWNARATAFFHAGRYGESLADIARTLELEPRHFGALAGLAAILQELGQDARALEAYRAVRAIHPHRPGLDETIERLERVVEGVTL